MSKQIKIVIGANFGDEGKGLMTDYFCNELSACGSVLNIRHNGGAQAGHTVVTPDGKRHVFSHFGSGSFVPHVATYLSKDFILNPMLFMRELEQLKSEFDIQPKVYVHKECRISTPYDMIVNQILERKRGADRHGSCGVGINETVERYKLCYGVTPGNFTQEYAKNILCNVRKYIPKRLSFLNISELSESELSLLDSEIIAENYLHQLEEMLSYCIVTDDSVMQRFDGLVFEGAQGLLLDEDNLDFAPHLTTSKTGSVNPKNIILANHLEKSSIEICYITRPYFTRHGAGYFPTECNKADILDESVVDNTNHTNEFQGALRYGYFDTKLFKAACTKDVLYRMELFPNLINSVAITHCDETDGYLLFDNGSKAEAYLLCDYGYLSNGVTRDDIVSYDYRR